MRLFEDNGGGSLSVGNRWGPLLLDCARLILRFAAIFSLRYTFSFEIILIIVV